MTKFFFLLFILFVLDPGLKAGAEFSTENKDAVVLFDSNIFTITGPNSGKLSKHVSIRINNENARDLCDFVISEGHYTTITEINGSVKDTQGNIIKELENEQIKKSSIHAGSVLHSDARNSYFTLDHNNYPFIIDVYFEKEYKSLFLWPDWNPQNKYPILKSSYKLVLQHSVPFRTLAKGIENNPQIYVSGQDSVYFWHLNKIPEQPDEPVMDPEDKYQYKLLFSPIVFSIDHFSGSFKSWDTFSHWYRKLCHQKYNLDHSISDEINTLIKNATTDREKIEIIYSYMQEKTRYVAVELGVGSWQPSSANTVYENRFGDCKDLSTFLIAALKHIGIDAYPVLIRTWDGGAVYKEFPYNYFNHVITCVPLQNDTIWLENTADHLAAGELPWIDEGCNVLVITNSSGKILKTPVSKSYDNSWKSKIEGELSPQGNFDFVGRIFLSGNEKNYVSGILTYNKQKDFEDWLKSRIGSGIPGFSLKNYDIRKVDTRVELVFKATIRKFGNKTGRRLFINPNILNERTGTVFEENTERKFPVKLRFAYLDVDTVSIKLPYGYKLEAAPEDVTVEFDFGNYRSSFEIKDGVFNHYRHFEYISNDIPAEKYNNIVKLTNTAIKRDQSKYVFKK